MARIDRVLAVLACVPGFAPAVWAAAPSDYVVQAQAAVQASPPKITLSWINLPGGAGYSINRRTWNSAKGFTHVASNLPATADTWTDSNVLPGSAYEYQIIRAAGTDPKKNPTSYGYVAAAINLPLVDRRGTAVLLVDKTQAGPLSAELARFQADLASDGWNVIRHDVPRSTCTFGTEWKGAAGSNGDADGSVIKAIKTQVKADVASDPGVSHVLVIGHVPVPYAGKLAPDGHGQHIGAWPADAYYGNLAGNWTDRSVNAPYHMQSGGDNNANVIGDGRFDQSTIPGSGVQLAVGRVDLSNMPAFAPLTETDLLRRYLAKDHAWRTGQWAVPSKCLVDADTFGDLGPGWGAPGACGWRISSVVGIGNVEKGDWLATLPTESRLFAYGCGWGTYKKDGWDCAGVANTADFAGKKSLAVFTMLFGSYFIDWNRRDDLLRAVLANDGYGLTCLAAGRPNVVMHRMALGASIGDCWRLTQESTADRYPELGGEPRGVHLGLMGDPTLRAHPIVPPGAPVAVTGRDVVLSWAASPTPGVVGYHIYRAASPGGPFVRRSGVPASAGNPSGAPVTGTTWTDAGVAPGAYTYLVKAVKSETTPGGTYYNTSLGAAADVKVGKARISAIRP
ncbi:MAG: hypothetical protein PHC88_04705 [Terrimicrobiaceae bacterium]|nr:hypothetical protein [Terrimicrobiaceae bacterium]